jgi:hypothetical protein
MAVRHLVEIHEGIERREIGRVDPSPISSAIKYLNKNTP